MFEKRLLTLKSSAARVTQKSPDTFAVPQLHGHAPRTQLHLQYRRSRQRQQHQRQHQRQHTSNYCSTARLHSCAECLTASPRLLTCNSACGQSAITGSKATGSSISREASEKRNRTAAPQ